jgi:hypothetical protein
MRHVERDLWAAPRRREVLHGKEGVDGSSPSESSLVVTKPLQMAAFLLALDTAEHLAVKEDVGCQLDVPTCTYRLEQAV